MSDRPVLLTADIGSVRLLTLNRPDARNALSGELNTALYQALEEADVDDAVKAVVVTGADPAFCAGLDLKEAGAEGAAFFRRFQDINCIVRIGEMRKPVVGAVNGAAFTGGLEIALGCDFLIASERAVFADTHVRVGVLPGGGLTARLPRVVGAANARRMSMTGEVVDAARAERIGLVSEVVPHGELLERAMALASSAADVPAAAMRDLKRMYTQSGGLADDLAAEVAIAHAYRADYDGIEGRRAQVQSRNRAQISQEKH
ncbi:enoyl-CoA hydratase [Actinocorallia sp. B10E7]|uniref:enoyl-CoA hydratase n=1 Tax=Actinocorallia sp. B10E7 TaxID=3153558 RepID=UPI00325DADF8